MGRRHRLVRVPGYGVAVAAGWWYLANGNVPYVSGGDAGQLGRDASGATLPGMKRPLSLSVKEGICSEFRSTRPPVDPTTRVPRNVPPRTQLRTPNAAQLRQQQQEQRRAGPPVNHEALLSLLADTGLSSAELRQAREKDPGSSTTSQEPPSQHEEVASHQEQAWPSQKAARQNGGCM